MRGGARFFWYEHETVTIYYFDGFKYKQCIILTVSNKGENTSVERTCGVFGRDVEGGSGWRG